MVNTSASSLQALGVHGQKTHMDLVETVVRQACKRGAKDISMREIQQALERDHGVRLDMSSISGRVHGLVTAKRIVRGEEERKCTVTGRDIKPLSAPMVQGSLAL